MLLTDLSSKEQLQFQLLEKLSAKSASKKGVYHWLTPPKYKATAAQKSLLRSASVSRIPFDRSSYQSGSDTYYMLYRWGQGPTVLLLHDWGGAAAQMTSLVTPLVEAGYQVIIVDAPAHGDSPGKQTDMTELISVIKDIEAKFGGFYGIFAHSCSATAAVVAMQEGVKTSRLILSNTAASIDFYLRRFSVELKASRQTMGRISAGLNVSLKRNIKDFSIINIVPVLNVPALLIHDQQNPIVQHIEAVALDKLWPACELILTQGLGHDGILTDPATIYKITRYIAKNSATREASGPAIKTRR